MTKIPDITIVGGGVIGLLTAREFIKAGATVTIIEKNRPGPGVILGGRRHSATALSLATTGRYHSPSGTKPEAVPVPGFAAGCRNVGRPGVASLRVTDR